MANVKYWVWLAQMAGIPGPVKTALLAHFGGPEALYYADREERAPIPGGLGQRFFLSKNMGSLRSIVRGGESNG